MAMNAASEHYDLMETREPAQREADVLGRLPGVLAKALTAPGWRKQLGNIDAKAINSREALAKLPVLYKSDLPALHKASPPFGGLAAEPLSTFGRLFASPGPIFEGEGIHSDPWRAARGMFAAGFRKGDVVLNTFAYHFTPGGLFVDAGCRALGCPVIPAGPGNTEQQLQVIGAFKPVAYAGTPDFLKILLDACDAHGVAMSIKKASVGAAAFPPSLQRLVSDRGVAAYQTYGAADVGMVAYETPAREGMVVNEDVIVEIVRPGTGEPVPDGEVGEVVVTTLDPHHPMIRLALGDLSAVMAGASPCGRTNRRIKGWMGRADQTAKVKGMLVRPDQVAEIAKRHPELKRLRLVITRRGETDAMTLRAEAAAGPDLHAKVAATLQDVAKLRGDVELVAPGSLPNDGKVIADERTYD
jgi:phenylacetate-CoA ligase